VESALLGTTRSRRHSAKPLSEAAQGNHRRRPSALQTRAIGTGFGSTAARQALKSADVEAPHSDDDAPLQSQFLLQTRVGAVLTTEVCYTICGKSARSSTTIVWVGYSDGLLQGWG
jgi:hypothetical protein